MLRFFLLSLSYLLVSVPTWALTPDIEPQLPRVEDIKAEIYDSMPGKSVAGLDLLQLSDLRGELNDFNDDKVAQFGVTLSDYCRAYTELDKKARKGRKGPHAWDVYESEIKPKYAAELKKCGSKDSQYIKLQKQAESLYSRRMTSIGNREFVCMSDGCP